MQRNVTFTLHIFKSNHTYITSFRFNIMLGDDFTHFPPEHLYKIEVRDK